MNTIFWYRKLIPLLFSALFVFLFALSNSWYHQSGFWHQFKDYSPAYSFVCEHQNFNSMVRQPLNTVSNFLLLFFGLEIVIFAYYDRKYYKQSPNLIRMNYHYSLMFGLSIIFLFLGSTIYHASMLDFFCWFDMMGIYACILFPLVITIHKLIAATWYGNQAYYSYWGSFIATIVFVLALLILATFFWNDEAYLCIPILVALLFGLSCYHNYYYVTQYRKDYLLLSLGFITVAFGCYFWDMYYCDSQSYFQWHSIWHIVGACSLYYFYLFLRSQKNLILKKQSLKS